MNVKYIGNDTAKSENGKVHKRDGNYTCCGKRIDDNPKDWVETSEAVTCEKMVTKIKILHQCKRAN